LEATGLFGFAPVMTTAAPFCGPTGAVAPFLGLQVTQHHQGQQWLCERAEIRCVEN
jgi:hypothetical protein